MHRCFSSFYDALSKNNSSLLHTTNSFLSNCGFISIKLLLLIIDVSLIFFSKCPASYGREEGESLDLFKKPEPPGDSTRSFFAWKVIIEFFSYLLASLF